MISTTITSDFKPSSMKSLIQTCASKNDRRKRKRVVSFAQRTQTRFTIHRKDYTSKEFQQTWMTINDVMRIKASNQKIIAEYTMRDCKEGLGADGDDCFRGLEKKTQWAILKRIKVKSLAKKAVLKEQRRMKKKKYGGVVDSQKLADAYSKCTQDLPRESHEVALRDASEAALANVQELSQALPSSRSTQLTAAAIENLSLLPMSSLQQSSSSSSNTFDNLQELSQALQSPRSTQLTAAAIKNLSLLPISSSQQSSSTTPSSSSNTTSPDRHINRRFKFLSMTPRRRFMF